MTHFWFEATHDVIFFISRVVVFIADGLRAESFLQHGANRTTYLQEVIVSKGAFGISNTRVPTESRPGHVALFAGWLKKTNKFLVD